MSQKISRRLRALRRYQGMGLEAKIRYAERLIEAALALLHRPWRAAIPLPRMRRIENAAQAVRGGREDTMGKPAKLITVAILVSLLAGGCCGFLSLRRERQMVNAIPAPPGTIDRAKFHTTWPDSIPSAGWLYTTNEEPEKILEFYKRKLPQRDWKLTFEHGPCGLDTQGMLTFEKAGFRCTIGIRGKERPYRVTISIRRKRSR